MIRYHPPADLGLAVPEATRAIHARRIRASLRARTGVVWSVRCPEDSRRIIVVGPKPATGAVLAVADRAELRQALAWPEEIPARGVDTQVYLTDLGVDDHEVGISREELVVRADGHGLEVNRRRKVLGQIALEWRAECEAAGAAWRARHAPFWTAVDGEVGVRLARQAHPLRADVGRIEGLVVAEVMRTFGLTVRPSRYPPASVLPAPPVCVFEPFGDRPGLR